MKITKPVAVSLVLLIVVASLYRIFPDRPYGFAPQYAMAIFGGALFVRDKKWAFLLPVVSMFLSDLLYQLLYNYGLSPIYGFYEGQWQNYLLFASLTCIGFLVKKINVPAVLAASLASPTVYFILSYANGEPSQLMSTVQKQLEQLEHEIQRTRLVCSKLQELDLLRDMRFEAQIPGGQSFTVDGFFTVDEARLNALPDATLVELQRTGVLGVIHDHLIWLGSMRRQSDWRAQRGALAPAAAPSAPGA